MENRNDDEMEIDLLKLARALWRRAWAIMLAAVIFGGAALTYTAIFVTPLYKAEALMYVNSSNISVGGAKVSISQGELTAAQSLIKTYAVILSIALANFYYQDCRWQSYHRNCAASRRIYALNEAEM